MDCTTDTTLVWRWLLEREKRGILSSLSLLMGGYPGCRFPPLSPPCSISFGLITAVINSRERGGGDVRP